MVHPAAKICQNPERALVIGGGDGCIARELLRYQKMHIDMVEIDSHVIEFSKSYLKDLNQGSLEDSRVNLVIDDACKWILDCDTKYDLIYLDITDPGMDSPSESILNEEVISKIISSLKTSGVLVTQADNSQICPEQTEAWVNLFNRHRLNVKTLTFPAISYGGSLSFALACRDKIDMHDIDFSNLQLRWLNSKKLSSIINIYGE
jgi:spermidine synthase